MSEFNFNQHLINAIKDFTPRKSQTKMADEVYHAIKNNHTTVIEAGTGTGKTFAYLVPALLFGKKTVISTGSKNLQDQLFEKDIPTIKKSLNYKGKINLLKGRNNYLCLQRLDAHYHSAGDFIAKVKEELSAVKIWSLKTNSGDVNQCEFINESSQVIPLVTSTNENCLGNDCSYYADCYVFKARKKALEADIVIVNHHLYLADIIVKESGFGELIPKTEAFIFDEAHQLPDLACKYFGEQLSIKQLNQLKNDIYVSYQTEARDQVQLKKCADNLEKCSLDLKLQINQISMRDNINKILKNQNINMTFEFLLNTLNFCYEVLSITAERSKSLKTCLERTHIYLNFIKKLIKNDVNDYSYWFELMGTNVIFYITPLNVAEKFKKIMIESKGSWIFTSATLAVNNDFSYFTNRMGLQNLKTLLLESPFEYNKQSILCVPRYLESQNDKHYATKLAKKLLPTIEINKGRCFLLCTSNLMMNELANSFKMLTQIPILVQGETTKSKLIDEFINKGNALLIATNSFWEGVDVKGDVLSCVIIDKLPFTSPDEPLMKARIENCKKQGLDPFNYIQIPEAVIALKQGVGRLIRDNNDKGAIIICDNRLVNRFYGKIFLNSLPPSQRTRDLKIVNAFLLDNTI